jgi:hypothetical protein
VLALLFMLVLNVASFVLVLFSLQHPSHWCCFLCVLLLFLALFCCHVSSHCVYVIFACCCYSLCIGVIVIFALVFNSFYIGSWYAILFVLLCCSSYVATLIFSHCYVALLVLLCCFFSHCLCCYFHVGVLFMPMLPIPS